MDISIITTAA